MIRPTARALLLMLAGLVLATLPALLGDPWASAWLLGLASFAIALLVDFALLPSTRRLSIEVEAPNQIYLAQPATLLLRAVATFAMQIDAEVEIDGDCAPLPPVVLTSTDGQPAIATVPLVPLRRGLLQVRALHLRWRGPLGLLWREHLVATRHEVKVMPDVLTTRRQVLRVIQSREFQVGMRIERYVGDGSEFESLRDFVPGMDRRAVDWKASARHRVLLCRQFRAERNHQVMLCVDSGRLMGEQIDGLPRLDHAIHAALQLGHVCLRTGDRVGMFAFADRGLATLLPASGATTLHAIQARLASIDYSTTETNFTRCMTELLQRLRRRTLVVLFTDFVDSIGAELMLPNVQRLARRHLVLFVALRDPLLLRLTNAPPDTVEDLHRAVIAAEMSQERELVLERIRTAGVQVIDAEARDVGTDLINRYLQVKRREMV